MRKYIMSAAIAVIMVPVAAAEPAEELKAEATLELQYGTAAETTSARTYSVTAEGNRRDSRDDVYDMALAKAAKKTLRSNYDWFRVLDSETERDTIQTERSSSRAVGRYERTPVKRCGLLGCTTRYETSYRADFDTDFPERRETTYEVTLDFEMGEGPVKDGGRVYDARNVQRTR